MVDLPDQHAGTRTFTLRLTRRRLKMLVVAALAGTFIVWLAWPNYLVLDIPVAKHSGGVPFWTERHEGRLGYYNEWSVAYVRRLTASSEPEVHGWRTPDEAFAFFDRWLTSRGWQLSGTVVLDPILPESIFLKPENMRHYWMKGSRDRVLLAIWPRASDGWLNVVLVTSRATPIEKFNRFGEPKKEGEED